MSVHAGSIIHLAGQNVIDRIQSAGLGNVNLPIDTIREVGNREVVDKIPQEPDFNFTLNSFNVSVEVMAWLTGYSGGSAASAASLGASAPDGTTFDWLDCVCVNVVSPWKADPDTGASGVVAAGHIVPAYYPTSLTYSFGVADDATQEVQLSGGSFYYIKTGAPIEKEYVGNGSQKVYTPTENVIEYREGGAEGTTFRRFFGVLVNGVIQVKDVDYTETGGAAYPGASATLTFTTAPPAGSKVKFCVFVSNAQAYPQSVHASTVVLPGAVRGKNIKVYVNGNRVSGIQSATLTATVDATVDRELGNVEIVGRTINGTDTNGTLTVRSKDKDAFFDLLHHLTQVPTTEVFGWFNDNLVDLQIKIENPKNPGQIIKTLWIQDAKFQPPGTEAQVNSPTDFALNWASVNGSFLEVKGDVEDPHHSG